MELPPHSKPLLSVVGYSDQFDYPLNFSEIWYWQIRTGLNLSQIKKEINVLGQLGQLVILKNTITLPGRQKLITLRKQREIFSQKKWLLAKSLGNVLSRFPTVQAIFVTGSLAMNNSPEDDDIDLMIVTAPNTLWLTRFFLVLYLNLNHLRRFPSLPEHSSHRVADKICDNLYLDTNHLRTRSENLFLAHEVLQAKPVFDKSGIHRKFLFANDWVKDYLPVAYNETLKSLKNLEIKKLNKNFKFQIENLYWLLWPLNLLFFVLQYLYMLPKHTSEQIGLDFAYFHPRSVLSKVEGRRS